MRTRTFLFTLYTLITVSVTIYCLVSCTKEIPYPELNTATNNGNIVNIVTEKDYNDYVEAELPPEEFIFSKNSRL